MHCRLLWLIGRKRRLQSDLCRPGPVSQILSTRKAGCVAIFLVPVARSALRFYSRVQLIPGNTAGRRPFPCLSCIARGFPCLLRYLRSGGLLPHLFTLTLAGGLFSVALSVHPALAPGVSCFHRTRCLMMSRLSSTEQNSAATTRTRTARAESTPRSPEWQDKSPHLA